MTIKDKATIQRMLGKIEGVAFTLNGNSLTAIFDAIEVIDEIMEADDSEEGVE